jgi:hypothetical protein
MIRTSVESYLMILVLNLLGGVEQLMATSGVTRILTGMSYVKSPQILKDPLRHAANAAKTASPIILDRGISVEAEVRQKCCTR